MGKKRKRRESSKPTPVQEPVVSPRDDLNWGLLASAWFGLAVSCLLMLEYLGDSYVCTVGGGCDIVRNSPWANFAGTPVPVYGVIFFALLIAFAAVPAARPARVPWALIGAAAGVGFLVIQAAIIGVFCPLCVIVDFAAIAAGVLAWLGRDRPTPVLSPGRAGALAVAVLLPVGTSTFMIMNPVQAGPTVAAAQDDAQLPAQVAREQKAEGPVTVVEYIDFECPACRFQHQVFKEVLADVDYDVRMVYMHSPLPQHAGAEIAARAFICVEASGEPATYKAFADRLFNLPQITDPEIDTVAAELGIDVDAMRRCVDSETTTSRLERDLNLANQVGVRSLPTFWIGRQKFVGTSDAATVRAALDRWVRLPAQE